MSKWSKRWEMLPAACDRGWRYMDKLATPRETQFINHQEMEKELQSIRPASFSGYKQLPVQNDFHQFSFSDSNKPLDTQMVAESLYKRKEISIKISTRKADVSTVSAAFSHLIKSGIGKEVPCAVFMGGLPSQDYMAVLRRPLSSKDFEQLWSVHMKGLFDHGSLEFG